MQAFLAKFYEAVIIILTAFLLLALLSLGVQSWRVSHWKTVAENAELKCNQEKNDIHADYKERADKDRKAYQEALAKRQETINQLSADYEQVKAEQQVKTEYIIKEVEKIIHRPVYHNMCLDDDGIRLLNSQILEADGSSESEAALLEFADTR